MFIDIVKKPVFQWQLFVLYGKNAIKITPDRNKNVAC